MKKVVGVVVAVIVVLGVAGFVGLHAGDASGQPAKAKAAASRHGRDEHQDVFHDGRRPAAGL